MTPSIPRFLKTVEEIEQNSWWHSTIGPQLRGTNVTYTNHNGVESITHIPSEPLEALLLRIRRLTMKKSDEHLISIQKHLKQTATSDDRKLLDVWWSYWRLSLVKFPLLVNLDGKQEILTPYRAYDSYINGHYFHGDPECGEIVYKSSTQSSYQEKRVFPQHFFYTAVMDLGFAAIALHRYVNNGNTFAGLTMLDGLSTAFAFYTELEQHDHLDEQYKTFSEWIERNGGCSNCRWT
jgi:hypothetical protein